jgi:hypothetical protein
MLRFRLLLLLVLAFTSPALAQRNTLDYWVDYAENTGTLAIKAKGDSTGAYAGQGHSAGFAGALLTKAGARGVWSPPNISGGTAETNGYAFMRRRWNLSFVEGAMWSTEWSLPGYPTSAKALGFTVPVIGFESPQTTTLNGAIVAGDTSLTVADGTAILDPNSGFTAYLKIGNEIISYNNATGTLVNGGVVRGVNSIATNHASGATVSRVQVWSGPVSTYLGETTLVSSLALNTTPATIELTDASFLPKTNIRIRIGTEQINASTRTGNILSGTITRAVGGGAQPAQSPGTRVVQGFESPISGLVRPEHPLGVNSELRIAAFYKSLSASVITEATIQTEAYTQGSPANTDTSYTSIGAGTVTNMTGTAVGTLNKVVQTVAQATADRGGVTLNVSTARDTFGQDGPWGPAAVMGVGGFSGSRATGVVQMPPLSEGGKTLNDLHRELNVYSAAHSVNEFAVGVIEQNKMIRMFDDTDVGGNNNIALLHVCVFGHNETGDGGYGGPYIPEYPWTERPGVSTLIDGPHTKGDTTIDVLNAANLATQGMIYVEGQYIWYRTRTGTQLQDCVWGVFGSTPADLVASDVVYQGYPTTHPLGFASEVLFDYLWERDRWIDAGGSIETFGYVWIRPMPTSDSPTYSDQFSAALAGDAAREGRLREFATEISGRLGSLPGFVVLDMSRMWTAAEIVAKDYGASTTDLIHHTAAAYRIFHQRAVEYYTEGEGSPRRRGGLRGRPRRVIRKKKGRGNVRL